MSSYLPKDAITAATALACAVRDYDEEEVRRVLGREDLPAVAVALAAMVDIGKTPSELLAWNDGIEVVATHGLRPHGSHAAFNRHRINGEQPCDECRDGERLWQQVRHRQRVAGRERSRVSEDLNSKRPMQNEMAG